MPQYWTPQGTIDGQNRLTLWNSLNGLPEANRQSAVDYLNANYEGHRPKSWLPVAVNMALSYAAASAYGASSGLTPTIAPEGAAMLDAGASAAGGAMSGVPTVAASTGGAMGIFDGITSSDWFSTAKDIYSGVSSAAQLFRDVSGAAAPFLSYGATADQLENQYKIFKESQNFASSEAERAWMRSEASSGSSYQKAVKDLSAAGLNPMLAYRNGGATAMGSPAASAPSYPSMPSPGLNAITTALQVRGLDADVRLKEAQAVKASQDTKTSSAEEARTRADTGRIAQMTANLKYELEQILPAREKEILQNAWQRATQGNVNQQEASRIREDIIGVVSRSNLAKAQVLKLEHEVSLLLGDIKWQSTLNSVPVMKTVLEGLRTVFGRSR